MRKSRFTIAAVLFALSLFADTRQFVIDADSSVVTYVVADPLHTVRGTFKLKRGAVRFDAESGVISGEFVVDATSGDSGSHGRDSRMHKNILESAKFPEITFRPDRIDGKLNPTGDSDVKLHGMFAIHGDSHEMVLPAKVHIEGDALTATIDFPVPYVKWGMKNPSTLFLRVSDTVQIQIKAVGHLVAASPISGNLTR